jgi:hypothetical protein
MSDAFANRERCQAQRKDGTPCQAPAVRDGLCVGHQAGDHAAWRRKGGAATSSAARASAALPHVLKPVRDALITALVKVNDGRYTPAQGSAMAAIASAIVRVFVASEQEQRVKDLETAVARWERDRARFSA